MRFLNDIRNDFANHLLLTCFTGGTVHISANGNQLRTTELTITCSKSTIETVDKGVKYVQS